MWLLTAIITFGFAVTGQHVGLNSSASSPEDPRIDGGNFLWGVATAAYQIEGATSDGGRGPSIWDRFTLVSGKVHNGDTGANADRSYYLFDNDIELISNMGLKAYRFSISWSRIMPTGELPVNIAGIAHYNSVIDKLIANGIAPLVTLYHWDLPSDLEDKYGGWLNPQMEVIFQNYADVCFNAFGDRVKIWFTLNEPWTFAVMGYVTGMFAPGRCSDRAICPNGDSATEGYIVAHNALNAHAAAVELYRTKYQTEQQGRIGIALNHDFGVPWTDSEADVAAAQIRNEFYMGWFADPIYFGKYPDSMIQRVGSRLPRFTEKQMERLRGSVDFHAFNHYTTRYIYEPNEIGDKVDHVVIGSAFPNYIGWFSDQGVHETVYSPQGEIIGAQAASPWLYVVPWGFYEAVMWNHRRYSIDSKSPVIYITENGCDVLNEAKMAIADALNDTFRVQFYQSYLSELRRAIRDGADVRGYMAWSLLDNFEWADGYDFRFGLHYVDYADPTLPRYPKMSAHWYSTYARNHPYFGREINEDEQKDEGSYEGLSRGPVGEEDDKLPKQKTKEEKEDGVIVTREVGLMGLFEEAMEAVRGAPLYGVMGIGV